MTGPTDGRYNLCPECDHLTLDVGRCANCVNLVKEVEGRMRLVPVDAVVIPRDADGELPAELFRAAAKELQEIVGGAVAHKTRVTSELAGHWAGRILGAALNAITPPEGSVIAGKQVGVVSDDSAAEGS